MEMQNAIDILHLALLWVGECIRMRYKGLDASSLIPKDMMLSLMNCKIILTFIIQKFQLADRIGEFGGRAGQLIRSDWLNFDISENVFPFKGKLPLSLPTW